MPLIIRNYQQSYQPSENNGKALFSNGALAAKAKFDLSLSIAAGSFSGSFPYIDYDEDYDPFISYESDTVATDAYSFSMRPEGATFPFHDLSAPSCAVPELVEDRHHTFALWRSTGLLNTSIRFYVSTATIDSSASLFAPYWGTLGGQMPVMGNRACAAGEGIWSLWLPCTYHTPYGPGFRGTNVFSAWLYTTQPTHDIGAGLAFPLSTLDLKFYHSSRAPLNAAEEMLVAAVESDVKAILRNCGASITVTAGNVEIY